MAQRLKGAEAWLGKTGQIMIISSALLKDATRATLNMGARLCSNVAYVLNMVVWHM